MQKLTISQKLSQKLSPQQIQFIKLLQVPTAELETRIEEELEINPALEEGNEDTNATQDDSSSEESTEENSDIDVEDYLRDDDIGGYKMQGDSGGDEDNKEVPVTAGSTLHESLISQLGFLRLNEKQSVIAKQLIGSIDEEGYIRREFEGIINDLAFSQNIETDENELEGLLHKIQSFDPPGIGARTLKECLLLQLDRNFSQEQYTKNARRILQNCFEEFAKKHYDKIQKKLNIEDADLKEAVEVITRLNPKPGGAAGSQRTAQYIIPDFILTKNGDKLDLSLNSRNAPDLKISRSYSEMLDSYEKSKKTDKNLKQAVTFVKQKLDAAKWFIDAIKQRRQTLLRTMNAIIEFQFDFFSEEDESKLKPMILRDIAERIDMDVSTVSRVANSKSIQTEFGMFPLKYFFSEGITTDTGEDVSSREVKNILREIIDTESKKKPLSDEKLESMLKEKGYSIARRTVAKYREQMNIPVARLRKEL